MSDLLYERKNAFEVMNDKELTEAQVFCEDYKNFLDFGKTEAFCVDYAISTALEQGYKPFEYGKRYSAGDKIYLAQKGKAAIFANIGTEDLENGFNIIAAHIDCPRIDLKGNPLYEENNLAMFKTHYYGGILKYQWIALPLMLCGTIFKKDGTKVKIRIGDGEKDPVFCITDLLPHLGKDRAQKTAETLFTGESLNVLIGSSLSDSEKDKVKTSVLKILNEKYDINEEDFLTSELSLVPAERARDMGFDRSMILAFGHDDRVCAYPALSALMETKSVKKTAVVILADREEVGSMGITGLRSAYMSDFLEEICVCAGKNIRKAYANSAALSADVSAAFDPNYADVFELRNNAVMNGGIAINKFTGARGKSGASEANAEFIAKLCCNFDKNGVLYQFGELGKVDQGGGGTVSQYIADRNIEVVDIGVPVLSMHAPYETAAKNDIYMLYKASKVFFQ